MDEQDEITRPRRRGEPRPEPSSGPAEAGAAAEPAEHEPEPAGADAQAGAGAEAEHEQAPAQQPQPQPALAAQPSAEITRMCSFCYTQQPVSQLDDLGPLMRQCRDTQACAERAAASGMYPLSERELEQGLSAWEARHGALR